MAYKNTGENVNDKDLKTRWYVANFKKCVEVIEEISHTRRMQIMHVDENYGEILVEGSKFEGTITVIEANPRESAIDFTLGYRGILDFGKTKKEILAWYQDIEKKLVRKK